MAAATPGKTGQRAVGTLGNLWLKIILYKTVDRDRRDLEVIKINFAIYLFFVIIKEYFWGHNFL